MKRIISLLLSVCMLFALSSMAFADSEETFELNMPVESNWAGAAQGKLITAWCDKVHERTDGRVTVNILVGALNETEQYDAVVSGAFDMMSAPVLSNSGRFIALEALSLPKIGVAATTPSQAAWAAYENYYDEITYGFDEEVTLIGTWASSYSPPGISIVSNKPIEKMEDFSGLMVGVSGEWLAKTLIALGATPVGMAPSDLYDILQKGTVDASAADAEMVGGMKVYEVAKYYCMASFLLVPFYFVINTDVWNSMPEDIQQIMLECSAEIPAEADAYYADAIAQALIDCEEYGMEFIEYSEEELARWNEAAAPVRDEYIAVLDEAGLDGQAIFEMWDSLMAEYGNG